MNATQGQFIHDSDKTLCRRIYALTEWKGMI